MRNPPESLVTPAESLGIPLESPRNPPKMLQNLLIYSMRSRECERYINQNYNAPSLGVGALSG